MKRWLFVHRIAMIYVEFRPRIIVNEVRTADEVKLGFAVSSVCRKYFGFEAEYLGYVNSDEAARRSIAARTPVVVEGLPRSLFRESKSPSAELQSASGRRRFRVSHSSTHAGGFRWRHRMARLIHAPCGPAPAPRLKSSHQGATAGRAGDRAANGLRKSCRP